MQDDSLGGDVPDCGDPLTLNGVPLHKGTCSDGVYGCRACNATMRRLTDEQRVAYDAQYGIDEDDLRWKTTCDWCKKKVDIRLASMLRPWDEPQISYEVCDGCRAKHDAELEREIEYDRQRYGNYDYDY